MFTTSRKSLTAVVAALAIGMSSVLTPVAQAQDVRPDAPQRDGDRTVACSVDWNAEAIYDPRFGEKEWPNMGFSENVYDSDSFKKLLQVQHWGNNARVAVATSKQINNAKLIINLQEVEGQTWRGTNSVGRLWGRPAEPLFNKPIDPTGTIAGNVVTYDLGTLDPGSFFSTGQSMSPGFSLAQLMEFTKPAADGTWSDAFKVTARLTGDLAPGSTEDCKEVFGYNDATTDAGVPVDPAKIGEFTFPAETKYTVDKDDLPDGWVANIDENTGKLTVTPPADAEPGESAEVKVTATLPDGTVKETTVTVTVKDDDGAVVPGAGTCVAAGLTVGLPLLLLVPVGMAGQLNIPGLDQLNADLQAQLRNANSQLQQQFGIFDPAQAQQINQINSEIARFTADNRTIINGAAMVALGLLAASYLYNSCVGEDGTSSMSSLSSGSSE